VDSEILITPDLNGFIIGIDWLEKQGRFQWDLREGRIKFENEDRLELQPEETSRRICRVIVSQDTIIPPSEQTNVDVRVKHRNTKDKPYLGFVENVSVQLLQLNWIKVIMIQLIWLWIYGSSTYHPIEQVPFVSSIKSIRDWFYG